LSLTVNHPVIHRVEADIFRITFAADCIQHQCRCREEGNRRRNDACCQYGADVLIPEKAAILRRVREVASILKPERRDSDDEMTQPRDRTELDDEDFDDFKKK